MNEKEIREQYVAIVELIKEKRLKEAIQLLTVWIGTEGGSLNGFQSRLESIGNTYGYMLEYMRKGSIDPERASLHGKVQLDLWELTDQMQLTLLDNASARYYHRVRRKIKTSEVYRPTASLIKVLESYSESVALSQVNEYQDIDEVLNNHENANQDLFLQTWANSAWSNDEYTAANDALVSDNLPVNDLCLLVSAVTLSLMECFDERKMVWLMDVSEREEAAVNQRAKIGLFILFILQSARISLYPKITARLSLHVGDEALAKELNRIYIQLLLSQETTKIDRRIREELMPEMIKNFNALNSPLTGRDDNEESDEEDNNPNWKIEQMQSELDEVIREMSEWQLQGADIYFTSFGYPMRSFLFFKKIQNWFYPFDSMHSSLVHGIGLNKNYPGEQAFNFLVSSALFCDCDKYTFSFMQLQAPPPLRQKMMEQVMAQLDAEQDVEQQIAEIKKHAARPESIANQYIHDLYRFFYLNQRKSEFTNIFQQTLMPYTNPLLDKIMSHTQLMTSAADFLFAKQRYDEAIDIYNLQIKNQQAGDYIYQKAAFCLQKQKRYAEALAYYRTADTLKPDDVWTLRHTATCYRMLKRYDEALATYKQVERMDGDNANTLFYIGSCLAELGQPNEALQYFFKLEYLNENNVKAWRGIAWCSFAKQKYEQALKYYDKLLASASPTTTDYLNCGHLHWVTGNIEAAIKCYAQVLSKADSRDQLFELMQHDREFLLGHGIDVDADLSLMLDMV
ncbi:MAG: tetratricopeptide repeat protein [Mediterranea sp.]|jgi:tetratricopeptide (TPR) repeat protein|nr:tetratricopeptide repeat protein [Mediterranea sp.]